MHPRHFHSLPGKTRTAALRRSHARLLSLIAVFGFLSLIVFLYACNRVQATSNDTPGSSMANSAAPIPPIDAVLPINIQTATFALG